jgi:hypothetical protein
VFDELGGGWSKTGASSVFQIGNVVTAFGFGGVLIDHGWPPGQWSGI